VPPLFIDDLRNRRRSTLLASGSTGTAFVFTERGIVFGRYDTPPAAHDPREDLRWRLYVGHLTGPESVKP
jgi:hypothetical protein